MIKFLAIIQIKMEYGNGFLKSGENLRKSTQNKDENQQQTQLTFDTESRNRSRTTLVVRRVLLPLCHPSFPLFCFIGEKEMSRTKESANYTSRNSVVFYKQKFRSYKSGYLLYCIIGLPNGYTSDVSLTRKKYYDVIHI